MRFLIFLLIGTLIFGFKFPAYLFLFIFVAMIAFTLIIISLFRRGSSFKIYTNQPFRNRYQNSDGNFEPNYRGVNGEVLFDEEPAIKTEEADIFEEEGEIIELPSTALRKEE